MTEAGAARGPLARLARIVAGERRRIAAFVAVGVLNTAVGYALFAALFLLIGSYRVAAVAAFLGGVLFNFFSTGRLVFGSRRLGALLPFVAGYLAVLAINLALLELLVALGANPLIAQALSLPLVVIASYLINSRVVFRARCE